MNYNDMHDLISPRETMTAHQSHDVSNPTDSSSVKVLDYDTPLVLSNQSITSPQALDTPVNPDHDDAIPNPIEPSMSPLVAGNSLIDPQPTHPAPTVTFEGYGTADPKKNFARGSSRMSYLDRSHSDKMGFYTMSDNKSKTIEPDGTGLDSDDKGAIKYSAPTPLSNWKTRVKSLSKSDPTEDASAGASTPENRVEGNDMLILTDKTPSNSRDAGRANVVSTPNVNAELRLANLRSESEQPVVLSPQFVSSVYDWVDNRVQERGAAGLCVPFVSRGHCADPSCSMEHDIASRRTAEAQRNALLNGDCPDYRIRGWCDDRETCELAHDSDDSDSDRDEDDDSQAAGVGPLEQPSGWLIDSGANRQVLPPAPDDIIEDPEYPPLVTESSSEDDDNDSEITSHGDEDEDEDDDETALCENCDYLTELTEMRCATNPKLCTYPWVAPADGEWRINDTATKSWRGVEYRFCNAIRKGGHDRCGMHVDLYQWGPVAFLDEIAAERGSMSVRELRRELRKKAALEPPPRVAAEQFVIAEGNTPAQSNPGTGPSLKSVYGDRESPDDVHGFVGMHANDPPQSDVLMRLVEVLAKNSDDAMKISEAANLRLEKAQAASNKAQAAAERRLEERIDSMVAAGSENAAPSGATKTWTPKVYIGSTYIILKPIGMPKSQDVIARSYEYINILKVLRTYFEGVLPDAVPSHILIKGYHWVGKSEPMIKDENADDPSSPGEEESSDGAGAPDLRTEGTVIFEALVKFTDPLYMTWMKTGDSLRMELEDSYDMRGPSQLDPLMSSMMRLKGQCNTQFPSAWVTVATDAQETSGRVWSYWASLFLQIRQAYDLTNYEDVERARRSVEEASFPLSQYDMHRWWEMVTRLERIHNILYTNLGRGLVKVADRITSGKESCVTRRNQFKLNLFMTTNDYDGFTISKEEVIKLKVMLHPLLPRRTGAPGANDGVAPAGGNGSAPHGASRPAGDLCRHGPDCRKNLAGTCPKRHTDINYSKLLCPKVAKGEECSQTTGCLYGHDVSKYKQVTKKGKQKYVLLAEKEAPVPAAPVAEGPGSAAVPTVAAAIKPKGGGKGGAARERPLDCRDHTTGGVCPHGERCHFEHNEVLRKEHAAKKLAGTLPICAAFSRTGSCRFGNTCRYSHVAQPQTPAVAAAVEEV